MHHLRPLHVLALLLALCLSAAACSAPPERGQPVGRSFTRFADDSRPSWSGSGPRPLATTLWYPAAAGTQEEEWRIAVFRAGWNAPDAALAERPERLPLIVLSHGTGGAPMQLSWLAEELAANGYLVAAVAHHGNTGAEESYLMQGFALWWERALDLSVVIDRLLADPKWGPRIDPSRIGVAGFSLGGYTVLAAAGAVTDRDRYQRFCQASPADPSCVLPPEAPFAREDIERMLEEDPVVRASLARSGGSYRDERLRAAYAIAPALGPALDPASLAGISIPVRITVGESDDQALPDVTARPVAAAIPGASLQILPGVGHYSFLAPCSLWGRHVLPGLCKDPAGSEDRRVTHRRVAADAVEFFGRSLVPGHADESG